MNSMESGDDDFEKIQENDYDRYNDYSFENYGGRYRNSVVLRLVDRDRTVYTWGR